MASAPEFGDGGYLLGKLLGVGGGGPRVHEQARDWVTACVQVSGNNARPSRALEAGDPYLPGADVERERADLICQPRGVGPERAVRLAGSFDRHPARKGSAIRGGQDVRERLAHERERVFALGWPVTSTVTLAHLTTSTACGSAEVT